MKGNKKHRKLSGFSGTYIFTWLGVFMQPFKLCLLPGRPRLLSSSFQLEEDLDIMDKITFSQMFHELDGTSEDENDVSSLLKGSRKRKAQERSSSSHASRNLNAEPRSKSIQPVSSTQVDVPKTFKAEETPPSGHTETSSHKRRTKSFEVAPERQLFKGLVFCEHPHI